MATGAPPPERGGPDAASAARPADRRAAPLRPLADARRGRGRPAEDALRRRRRAAPAARPVQGDDPQGGARAAPLQEADRRPRPVRRLRDPHRADRRRSDGGPTYEFVDKIVGGVISAELPARGRQGRARGDGARRARRRARLRRPRHAHRRDGAHRRLLGDGVQDRRLAGVQGGVPEGRSRARSSRSWARGDGARRDRRRGQRRPQLAARPPAGDGAGGRDDDDQGRGADGRDPHVRPGAHLDDGRARRLLDALPPLRGSAAHVAQKIIEQTRKERDEAKV